MDIWNIPGLDFNKRLIISQTQSLAKGLIKVVTPFSTVLIEGYSYQHNCIYGRVLHGQTIGTEMTGVPGWGAVCIRHSDLNGFKVEVK